MRDLTSHAVSFHLKAGSTYTTAQVTESIDLSQYSEGAFLLVNILVVQTQPCNFIVQDSDDDTTFAATGLTWEEAVTVVAHSAYVFVHPRKLRRYVRLRFTPLGTLFGGSVNAVAAGRHNGELPVTTFAASSGS